MRRDKPQPSMSLYRLNFGHDLEASQVSQLLSHLATGLPQSAAIVFEVISTGRRIEHRLRVPEPQAADVLRQLRATLALAWSRVNRLAAAPKAASRFD